MSTSSASFILMGHLLVENQLKLAGKSANRIDNIKGVNSCLEKHMCSFSWLNQTQCMKLSPYKLK